MAARQIPPPAGERVPASAIERAFERKIRLSKWALLFEQLWPRAWLVLGLAGLHPLVRAGLGALTMAGGYLLLALLPRANLGFGDVATLVAVLSAGRVVGDAGSPLLLERYARKRAAPVLAMQWMTDGLIRLFDPPALKRLRNTGMRAVAAFPLVKTLLAQPALR